MATSSKCLMSVLQPIEDSGSPCNERSIMMSIIKTCIQPLADEQKPPTDVQAELTAFRVIPSSDTQESPWHVHFAPLIDTVDAEGRAFQSPALSDIVPDFLEHWKRRALATPHPVLRARYADLVWDMTELVCGRRPEIANVHIAIDAYNDAVNNEVWTSRSQVIHYLSRALALSLATNDLLRLARCRAAALAHVRRIPINTLDTDVTLAFDLLVTNRKTGLSPDERQETLDLLKERVEHYATNDLQPNGSVHVASEILSRLARQFAGVGNTDALRDVLRIFRQVVLRAVEGSPPLLANLWLTGLIDQMAKYGATEDRDMIQERLRKAEQETTEGMQESSTKVTIPKEEMDRFLAGFLTGTAEDALDMLAAHYVPEESTLRDRTHSLAEDFPLQSHSSTYLLDGEGRIVRGIGAITEDIDSRIVQQIAQDMSFRAPFLRAVFERLSEKSFVGPEDIVRYLRQSPVYGNARWDLIEEALEEYFNGRYCAATHLLIPEIERTLRYLLALLAIADRKAGRDGFTRYLLLDEILREPRVVSALSAAVRKYFIILLTDSRGWNLRNDVCHGLISDERCNAQMADRVLHVLLVLAHVRASVEPTGGETSESVSDEL